MQEDCKEELLEQDFPAYIDNWRQFIRVQVGSFNNLDEAVAVERRLKSAGYETLIINESQT